MKFEIYVPCSAKVRYRGKRKMTVDELPARIPCDLPLAPAEEVAPAFAVDATDESILNRPEIPAFDVRDTVFFGGSPWMALAPSKPAAGGDAVVEQVLDAVAAATSRVRRMHYVKGMPTTARPAPAKADILETMDDTRVQVDPMLRKLVDRMMVHDGKVYVRNVVPVYVPDGGSVHVAPSKILEDDIFEQETAFGPDDRNAATAYAGVSDAPRIQRLAGVSDKALAHLDASLLKAHVRTMIRALEPYSEREDVHASLHWIRRLGGPQAVADAENLQETLDAEDASPNAVAEAAAPVIAVLKRAFLDEEDHLTSTIKAVDGIVARLSAAGRSSDARFMTDTERASMERATAEVDAEADEMLRERGADFRYRPK